MLPPPEKYYIIIRGRKKGGGLNIFSRAKKHENPNENAASAVKYRYGAKNIFAVGLYHPDVNARVHVDVRIVVFLATCKSGYRLGVYSVLVHQT